MSENSNNSHKNNRHPSGEKQSGVVSFIIAQLIAAMSYAAAVLLLFAFTSDRTAQILSFSVVLPVFIAVSLVFTVLACRAAAKKKEEAIGETLRKLRDGLRGAVNGRRIEELVIPSGAPDEVTELYSAVNSLIAAVKALDNMRSDFMSSVSHDMRTPMTTISGFIDCILEGAVSPEKQEHYLRLIKDEVMRLSRLVSSLLDIARIQAGDREFVKEPFDICEITRVILFSFEQKIDEKKLDVEVDFASDNIYASGDPDAVHQVIYNIIDNAVKFSNPSGVLTLRASETGDGKVLISVKNDGDGIAYEDQPFVFERFFKSDRTRGLDKSGSGLGMYISKAIIDALGGELKLDSVPGEYCRFYFTLPAAENAPKRNYRYE